MPVESVAAYINNTFTFVIFILVCSILFLLIFFISKAVRKKVLNRSPEKPYRETDDTGGGKSFKGADPFKKRNEAILGLSFALVFLSVVLILASFYFSLNIGMGIAVFIISFIILAMLVVLVYIFKSGVFSR